MNQIICYFLVCLFLPAISKSQANCFLPWQFYSNSKKLEIRKHKVDLEINNHVAKIIGDSIHKANPCELVYFTNKENIQFVFIPHGLQTLILRIDSVNGNKESLLESHLIWDYMSTLQFSKSKLKRQIQLSKLLNHFKSVLVNWWKNPTYIHIWIDPSSINRTLYLMWEERSYQIEYFDYGGYTNGKSLRGIALNEWIVSQLVEDYLKKVTSNSNSH